MNYSPKLKIAMGEIKAILKKHEIGGFVIIHTPGFSEYLNHINPPYSCAKMANGGFEVRLKADEVGGPEKARQIAQDTLNMISHFTNLIGQHALLYMQAEDMLKAKWPSDETPGEHTSQESLDN